MPCFLDCQAIKQRKIIDLMHAKQIIKVNPVKKENIPEKIIREIKLLIDSGQIVLGGRLPSERDLAALLNVSRSSLREALKALSILGIIENRHGDGNFITASSTDWPMEPLSIFLSVKRGAMIDLIDARQGLEITAAELAARRRTDTDIDHMNQAMQDMHTTQNKPELFYKNDLSFHRRLVAAANNPIIADLLEKIYTLSDATRMEIHHLDSHFYKYIGYDIGEHEKLLHSIKNKNPEDAVACMSRHMRSIRQRYLDMDESDYPNE